MSVTLLAGTNKGLAVYRSEDRIDWTAEPLAMQGWAVTAATHADDGTWFIGVNHPIYGCVIMRSKDLKDFEQCESAPVFPTGLPGNDFHLRITGSADPFNERGGERRVNQIWKLHADRDRVFAGVSEAGLFCSTDGGRTWPAVAGLNDHPTRDDWQSGGGGLCAHTILTDANDPDRIWVGISAAGLFRTDDGGATWSRANEGVSVIQGEETVCCVHAVAHDPTRSDRMFRQDHRGVYRSEDGGDTWTLAEHGLPTQPLSDEHVCSFGFPICFDYTNEFSYVIPMGSDMTRFPPDGKLRVYRSRDGARSWEPVGEGLPDDYYDSVLRGAMAVDQHSPGGVYFGTSSGDVFVSADNGEHWQQMPGGLSRVMCVAVHAR